VLFAPEQSPNASPNVEKGLESSFWAQPAAVNPGSVRWKNENLCVP
jgi:hypothetical protein